VFRQLPTRVVMPRGAAEAIGGGFPLPPLGSLNYPSTWKDFSTVKTDRQPLATRVNSVLSTTDGPELVVVFPLFFQAV